MGLLASSSSSAQLLLLLHFACLLLSLSLDAPNATSVAAAASPFSFSFDFTNTSSYRSDDLRFEGDAGVHGKLVELTCNSFEETTTTCQGRMSYGQPVPFYDKTTGEVASFSTRFTFAIKDLTEDKGEGMAFFLAYFPSSMPPNSSRGDLGLLEGQGTTAFDEQRFVAIEFDTFNNPSWDPSDTYDHIGIDISSVKSVNTTSLSSLNGSMTASITFDNTTRMLVASLQFLDNSSIGTFEVSKKLPDPLTLLPPEVAVGFSAATASSFELHQITSWCFNSTLAPAQINSTLAPAEINSTLGPAQINSTLAPPPKRTSLIGGLIGGALVLVLLVWFIISWCKLIGKRYAFEKGTGGTRRFEYRDLAAATDNFSEKKKLGQGAFGAVYRGTSLKGLVGEVAVKKILKESSGEHKDFFAELNTIGDAKHKNLVKLKGWGCRGTSWNMLDFMCWCMSKKNEVFLVYELVPNGNLFDHLHKREAEVLPWPTRYKIVKDIGAALVYLHDECHPYILHRDIKPGNILLDKDFNAKLADFGLSRVANHDNAAPQTVAIGTEGYLDPQCRKGGKDVEFNRSSDVYSFGVVLKDIACREGITMEQVWHQYRVNAVVQAADEKLNGEFDRRQMERVIVLGLWCSLPDSTKRPTIREAMDVLERDTPLPDLNLLNTLVSTQQDTYVSSLDLQAPISADSCSNEHHP